MQAAKIMGTQVKLRASAIFTSICILLAALSAAFGAKEFEAVAERNGYWRAVPVPAEAVDITGAWCADSRPASITLVGGRLTIRNEQGMTTPGRFKDPLTIVALDWDGLQGTVVNHGKDLIWRNGSIWHRPPC